MVFAGEWNTIYAANRHLSVWPWSELVALVMRHARPGEATAQLRVLELGVGAGANIPFFASIGADFWGIDGSSVIIERLREAYPELADHFLVADFVADWPLDGRFDLIVDHGSLTHNTGADIARTLAQAKARLADGGLIVAVDLFSSAFDEYASGEPTEDHYTRCNFQRGRLAGTGLEKIGRASCRERVYLCV